MELHQLILLRELADRGSITAVAEASGRTPSAVSQQLRALQRQAGRTLIVRSGRGVRLTEAGRALATAAVGLSTAMAEVDAAWQRWLGEPQGPVMLSVFPSIGALLIPDLVARLERWPQLDLQLVDNDVSQQEFPGLTKVADLVLAHRGEVVDTRTTSRLWQRSLFTEPVDVALPLNHPLADRSSVLACEVVDSEWIGVPQDYPLDRLLEALALTARAPARVKLRSTDFGILAGLVAAGQGICLLPRFCTKHPGVRLVPVSDIGLGRQVELLARPDNAGRGAVRAVADELTEVCRAYQEDAV